MEEREHEKDKQTKQTGSQPLIGRQYGDVFADGLRRRIFRSENHRGRNGCGRFDRTHYARLIEAFNEQYAGKYHANLSQIARSGDAGGYDDKINAAISNGGLPDVYTVDGVTVAQYADAGAIVPIDAYFTEEELSDFNPSMIQQGTYDGKLYTLGAMDSSVGIFYKYLPAVPGPLPSPDSVPRRKRKVQQNFSAL